MRIDDLSIISLDLPEHRMQFSGKVIQTLVDLKRAGGEMEAEAKVNSTLCSPDLLLSIQYADCIIELHR